MVLATTTEECSFEAIYGGDVPVRGHRSYTLPRIDTTCQARINRGPCIRRSQRQTVESRAIVVSNTFANELEAIGSGNHAALTTGKFDCEYTSS